MGDAIEVLRTVAPDEVIPANLRPTVEHDSDDDSDDDWDPDGYDADLRWTEEKLDAMADKFCELLDTMRDAAGRLEELDGPAREVGRWLRVRAQQAAIDTMHDPPVSRARRRRSG